MQREVFLSVFFTECKGGKREYEPGFSYEAINPDRTIRQC